MKAKDLRKKSDEDLKKRLKDIDLTIMKFRSASKGAKIKVPSTPLGNPNWGIYRELRKEKARILTILNERGIKL